MWIILGMLGIVAICIVWGVLDTNENTNPVEKVRKNRERFNTYTRNNDIILNKELVNYDNLSGVGLNYQRREIYLFSSNINKDITYKKYSFDDLIEAEVVEDGVSLVKTSRLGQFAGFAVGGALAGGVGAAVGGLSSAKRNEDMIENVNVKMLFNDIDNPVHEINFFKPKYAKSVKKSDKDYKTAIKEIKNLHGSLKVIIEQNK